MSTLQKTESKNIQTTVSKNRLKEIIRTYTSPNTKRGFNSDVKNFLAWAQVTYLQEIEFTQEVIINYIIQAFEGFPKDIEQILLERGVKRQPGPIKVTTIEKRLRNFGIFLELNGRPNPVKTPEVRMLIRRLRQNFHVGRKKNPITREILDQIIEHKFKPNEKNIRDRAILLFGWGSGGRRSHEICDVKYENFELQPNGNYICTLEKTKTGRNMRVPVGGRAAKAIKDWIAIRGTKPGYMFFQMTCNGELKDRKLTQDGLRNIINKRIAAIGLDPEYYSPISIRSGFITEAGRQNMPVTEVMQMTTHKTMREMMEYYRHGSMNNNVCVNLVG